jgi:hypothetical protein
MAIATGTALAIAAGASAASGIASAKMASNASKKAAQTQANSATQANNLARDMYGQQFQMQSPYMMLGNSAANTLGRLMGSPAGARYAAPPMQQQPMAMLPGMGMAPQGQGGFARPRRAPMQGGGTLADLAMMR